MLAKQYIHKLSGIVLSVSLLVMTAQASAAGSPPPENKEPNNVVVSNQVVSTFVESNTTVDQSNNPGQAHAPEDSGFVSDGGGAVVSLTAAQFEAIPRSTAPVSPTATPKAHVQGELGDDLTKTQSNAASTTSSIADNADVPTNNVEGNAAGDTAKNFDGIAYTGWIPPDTEMAIGKDYIVEAVNSGFAINNLRGDVLQGYTTFGSFFDSVKPASWDVNGANMFDPRVVYQKEKQQFVMMVIGRDTVLQTSYNFIAISKTSDPTGAWWLYRSVANSGAGNSDSWLDYPSLGADEFGIYVVGNLFKWTGGFKHAHIRTYNPAMYSGGATDGWYYHNLQWVSGALASSLQVAQPHTINSDGETFMVNAFGGSGNALLLWSLEAGNRSSSGGGSAPALTKAEILTAGTYYGVGNNVDQPSSSSDIDGGDTRIMNAVYVNKRVFTTHASDQSNNGLNAAVISYELNTNTNAKLWEHTLSAGASSGWYYTYPAIVVNGTSTSNVNIGLYMTATHKTSTYPSATRKIYTDRTSGAGGPFNIYKSGLGTYVRFNGSRNRWGDYTGADYDWNCPGRMWGSAEYAAGSNNWATRTAGFMMDGSADCPLGRPALITKISPTGAITDTTPTYTWNASPDASDYHLYVNDPTGNVIWTSYTAAAAGCSSGTGTCSITPAVTLAEGDAIWWVKGVNSEYGHGPWGDYMSFNVVVPPVAPTLVSPLGITYDDTPTYRWNAVSNADTYRIYIYDDEANAVVHDQIFTKAAAGCSSGTGTCEVTYGASLDTVDHRFWVKSINVAGSSGWSSSNAFSVIGIPPAATLISPDGYTSDTTPTYTWNAVPESTYYRIYVNDSTGNKVNIWQHRSAVGCSSGTGTCSYSPGTVLANGQGKWYVKTYNPAGQTWSSKKVFHVNTPGKVTLISPTSTIADTTPTYTWNADPNTTYYKLYVNDSTGNRINVWKYKNSVGCGSGTGTCSYTPSTVLNSGAAKWWILTYNTYGYGPWSTGLDFEVFP